MWNLSNRTPFPADFAWVMDKDGNKIWLVVVKASFDILPDGRCCLAAEQDPVRLAAEAYGEFGQTSLQYEADLAGVKATTDVLVLGDAIAPRGRLATSIDVSLSAGPVHKRVRVTGERVWERGALGLKVSEPQAFERMPIRYERAFGGWDRSAPDAVDHRLEERNPVGTGFSVHGENCNGMPLPNIEYPDQLIASWKDRPAPAGLNAVDGAWLPRRTLAGTYDEKWRQDRFPLWAEDFDPRYRNCAPSDQQAPGFFTGGEHVEITGMSERGTLGFDLPALKFAFRTRFGSERVDHEGQLCTVLIEPNRPRVVLAWQTSLVCNRRADELDETVVLEQCSA